MQRIFAIFVFFLFSLATGHAMAGAIGNVVAVYGTVNASGPGGDRVLSSGAQVFEHDRVSVSSGNAQIELLDGTKLVLGPNSALVLERFLMKGGATAQNVSVDALRGTFRFITGNSPKDAYDIRTANSTIAIRGTAFDFWVRGRTGLALLKGNVRLCSRRSGHSCIDILPNCSIAVAGDPNPARIIAGRERNDAIRHQLRYLTNQSELRSQFRLDTSSCSRNLAELPPKGQPQPVNLQKTAPPPPPPCDHDHDHDHDHDYGHWNKD
jgi:hypothetical protein